MSERLEGAEIVIIRREKGEKGQYYRAISSTRPRRKRKPRYEAGVGGGRCTRYAIHESTEDQIE